MDMRLELVIIPVTDVDRAKAFYEQAGFDADNDHAGRRLPGRAGHAAGLVLLGGLRHGHAPARAPGASACTWS